jgi:hypothetical protein
MKNISISKKGILKLINNINPNKAVGPDNIAGKILKENADICSFLCSLLMKRLIGIAYLRYWLFLLDLHVRLLHF